MAYNTFFHLRVKDSTGAVVKIFSPASNVGKQVSVGQGEPIFLEREKLDYTTDNYFVGWKQAVNIKLECIGEKYIDYVTGVLRGSLEDVLNAMSAGYTLEYNITDSTADGPNWVACELKNVRRDKLLKKNIGVSMQLELVSKTFVSTAFAAG